MAGTKYVASAVSDNGDLIVATELSDGIHSAVTIKWIDGNGELSFAGDDLLTVATLIHDLVERAYPPSDDDATAEDMDCASEETDSTARDLDRELAYITKQAREKRLAELHAKRDRLAKHREYESTTGAGMVALSRMDQDLAYLDGLIDAERGVVRAIEI